MLKFYYVVKLMWGQVVQYPPPLTVVDCISLAPRVTRHSAAAKSLASTTMALRCAIVDAFVAGIASRSGNPAAVVLAPSNLSEGSLKQIAAEFALSETAFVSPFASNVAEDAYMIGSEFNLRWFTPMTEVALCGHATLAAAHVLFTMGGNVNDMLCFHTLSGKLHVTRQRRHGTADLLSMRFPMNPASLRRPDEPVISALVDQLRLPAPPLEVAYNAATRKLIVRLHDDARACLAALAPDVRALHAVDQSYLPPDLRVTGVSVTVRGDASEHFVSRYFTPWNGIDEDPVNGSSHTILADFWAVRLALYAPATSVPLIPNAVDDAEQRWLVAAMTARMLSPRGGVLHVEAWKCDSDATRSFVTLGGVARTFMTGELLAS